MLENVQLAAPAKQVAGPAYIVIFRNQGTAAAGNFEVAILVGLAGKLTSDASRAIVEVESLAASQVKEVILRLPIKAMQLNSGKRHSNRRQPHVHGRSPAPPSVFKDPPANFASLLN